MSAYLYELRARLVTLATGVTGGSMTIVAGRIKSGYTPLGDTDTLLDSLKTAGPLLVLCPGDLEEYDAREGHGRFIIPAHLYIGIDQNAADALTNAETLAEALRVAWASQNQRWTVEVFARRNPAVIHYSWQVRALGCGA